MLDPERFGELRDDFSEADLKALLGSFLDLTPGTVDELVLGAAAWDAGATRAAAHKLRGGCLAIGVLRLARTSGELERLALGDALAGDPAVLVARAREEWRELQVALRAIVDRPPGAGVLSP